MGEPAYGAWLSTAGNTLPRWPVPAALLDPAQPRLSRRRFAAAGFVRAVGGDARAAEPARVETLLAMPVGGACDAYPYLGLCRMTLHPGAVESYGTSRDHGKGTDGFVVTRGRIRFEPDGPARVARAGSSLLASPVDVPAGSTTLLGPGDQAMTAPGCASRRATVGEVDAATIECSLIAAIPGTSHAAGTAYTHVEYEYFPAGTEPGMAPVPAVVTLWRASLPPGSTLGIGSLPGVEIMTATRGAVGVHGDTDPLLTSGLGGKRSPGYVVDPHSGLTHASARVPPTSLLHNAGAGVAVLYAVGYVGVGSAPTT